MINHTAHRKNAGINNGIVGIDVNGPMGGRGKGVHMMNIGHGLMLEQVVWSCWHEFPCLSARGWGGAQRNNFIGFRPYPWGNVQLASRNMQVANASRFALCLDERFNALIQSVQVMENRKMGQTIYEALLMVVKKRYFSVNNTHGFKAAIPVSKPTVPQPIKLVTFTNVAINADCLMIGHKWLVMTLV